LDCSQHVRAVTDEAETSKRLDDGPNASSNDWVFVDRKDGAR